MIHEKSKSSVIYSWHNMHNVSTAVGMLREPVFKMFGPHLKIKQWRYVWVSIHRKLTWLHMHKALEHSVHHDRIKDASLILEK